MKKLQLNIAKENEKRLATILEVIDKDGPKEISIYVNTPTPERLKALSDIADKSKELMEQFEDLQEKIEKAATEEERANLGKILTDLSVKMNELNIKSLQIQVKNFDTLVPYLEYIFSVNSYAEELIKVISDKFLELLNKEEAKKKEKRVR